MKKIILATLISGAMSASVFAAAPSNQGHGKVTFKGEIIDAPCSISSDSIDQTVDLGQIANSVLANGGASTFTPFTIQLEDCVLTDAGTGDNNSVLNEKVSITFSGASAGFDKTLLGMVGLNAGEGDINNVGIRLLDTHSKPINMGQATAQSVTLQVGDNTLEFGAFVQGADVTVDKIPLGKFEAVTNFTLAYN